MMSRIILWCIAKTNLLRNISLAVVGALIAAGVIDESGGQTLHAGLMVLFVGGLNYLIEHTKSKHVAEVQAVLAADEPLKVDGYLGPATKSAIVRKFRRKR
jgi:peptidoglycan hydrolase-like protein with peptidoglycan-binding domain